MKSNQKGIGVVVVVILFLTISIVCGAGFFVWQRQKDPTKIDSSPTQQVSTQSTEMLQEAVANNDQQSATQTTQEEKSSKPASDYYQINLPTGWKLTDQKPTGVSFDDAFIYTNDNGKELTIYVNIGNVGGAGDTFIEYTVVNEKIVLDIQNVTLPECSNDGFPCEKGDGKLRVQSSSAAKIKSNNYLFDYVDSGSESLDSLQTFKAIVESMTF